MMIRKGWSDGLDFVLLNFQIIKNPAVVYVNNYQGDVGLSKWYLQGYFHFHGLGVNLIGP